MKRHKEALGIQQGARNVRAIARSLVEATDEAAREGIGAEQDAAVRMIVHQLASVCNVDEIKYGFDPQTLKDVYCTLLAECEARANETTAQSEPAEAAPEQTERIPFPQVSTATPAPGTVAMVLHDGGIQPGRLGEPEEPFSQQEPRRGFITRFLFRGD